MPNHVTNKIEIISNNAQEALLFMSSDSHEFDFNNIIEMPESLSIESGTKTDAALAYFLSGGLLKQLTPEQIETYYENCFFDTKLEIANRDLETAKRLIEEGSLSAEVLMDLGQKVATNIDTYQCATWYGWAPKHWGTKWNAYEITITDTTVQFDTAWNSPHPVLTAWISKFNLTCTVKAFDEGHNFWFIKQYENGLLVDSRDNLKEDSKSLCKELKGYDPDEDEE